MTLIVPIARTSEEQADSKEKMGLPALPLPTYATTDSSGLDLLADIAEPITLKQFDRALIPTGLRLAIPTGFEAQVRSRSGLAIKHGIFTLNSPGTIDADYRGEVKVILLNTGTDDFTITRGMKIAQIVFCPVTMIEWQEQKDLGDTTRGAGGFGSTGMTR